MVEVGIMNYEAYRRNFFVELQPKSRFKFRDSFGVTLYFEAFDAAVKYYEQVLGPPRYVEGWGPGAGRLETGG